MDSVLLSPCIDQLPDAQRLHLSDVENLQHSQNHARGLLKTPSLNGNGGFLASLEAVRGGPLSAKNVWTTTAIAPQAPQPVQLPLGNGAFHHISDFWQQGAPTACHPQFASRLPFSHGFPDDSLSLESHLRAAEQLQNGDLLNHARLDLMQFASPVSGNPNMSSPLSMQSFSHNLLRPPLDLPAISAVQTVTPSLASPLPADLHMDLQQQFNELEYRKVLKNVLVENVHLQKQLEVQAAISPSASEHEDSLLHTLAVRNHENSQLMDELSRLRSEKEEWGREKSALLRELQQMQNVSSQHDANEKQMKSRNEQLFQETQQLSEALQQLTNRNLALLEEVEAHKRSRQRIRQEASKAEERATAEETADQLSCRAQLEKALQNAEQRASALAKENHETTQVLMQLTEQTQFLMEENARLSKCEQRLKELTSLIASSENGSEGIAEAVDPTFEAVETGLRDDDDISLPSNCDVEFPDAGASAAAENSPDLASLTEEGLGTTDSESAEIIIAVQQVIDEMAEGISSVQLEDVIEREPAVEAVSSGAPDCGISCECTVEN